MSEGETKVAVALVSGGIDSPVAVHRMAARGWKIYPLHCSQEPVTGPEAEEKTRISMERIRSQSGGADSVVDEMLVVPVGTTLAKFTEPKSHRDYFVHMKRLFNSIGCLYANEVGATHILTGENLGQVSSQTLGNLGAVEAASNLPILRPLLGFDKQNIIDEARKIGTFETSAGPETCDALGPNRPTTVAKTSRLEHHEEALGGLVSLAEECYSKRRSERLG